MLMVGHPNGCILGKYASGTHMQITCLFLIIIHVYKLSSLGTGRRTSCIRDEQTEAAAAHGSGHEFIHGEKSPFA